VEYGGDLKNVERLLLEAWLPNPAECEEKKLSQAYGIKHDATRAVPGRAMVSFSGSAALIRGLPEISRELKAPGSHRPSSSSWEIKEKFPEEGLRRES